MDTARTPVNAAIGDSAPFLALEQLAELRRATARLERHRAYAVHAARRLHDEAKTLTDLEEEIEMVKNELRAAVGRADVVRADLDIMNQAESALMQRLEELGHIRQHHRLNSYDVAKARLDSLRADLGLPRVPNIEEEVDANVARYLESRRHEWTRPVTPRPVPSQRPASPASSTSYGNGSSASSIDGGTSNTEMLETMKGRDQELDDRVLLSSQTKRKRTRK